MNDLMSKDKKDVDKIKVSSAEIVVHGNAEKPYYEIKYFDLSDNKIHIGYSSYNLDFVFEWLHDCFEIIAESAKETLEIPNIPLECVDGSCPMALSDEYEERGMDVVHSCAECPYQPKKEPQKCEWNRQGAEDFIITGCGHRPYKVIIDNCGFKIDFCPYCGRKIKVVE